MSQDFFRSSRVASVAGGYRFFRGLIRIWIALAFGKLRVLEAETLPASSPAVLVASHTGGFLEALFLIAATNRQLCCFVEGRQISGIVRTFLARRLGMIPYEPQGEGWRRAAETASNVLGNLGAIAVFTGFQPAETQQAARFALSAANIVLEAESRNANQLDVMVVPIHLVLTRIRSRSGELLVYFDRRIKPQVYMLPGKSVEERRPALSAALDEACRKNVFRLQPEDVRRFLADLEEVLIADLREDFASRRNWKQRVEEFRLSGFVSEWIEQLNRLDPGRLARLRQLLSAFREAGRRESLARLEVEAAGAWVQSAWRRTLAWVETAAGFPLALYSLVNHLPALGILRAAGLIKKQSEANRTALWISRIAVVLALYALQILLCDRWLGRAAAGYYALSLPISALYAWRYVSLLRHSTRFVYLRSRAPRRASQAREMRREFVRELDAARHSYVEAIGLAN
jgi:Acyltransferase